MYLGYFTVPLNQEAGVDDLSSKELQSLCLSLTTRFKVLARFSGNLLAVVALKESENGIREHFDKISDFLESKLGRIEADSYYIERIREALD